MTEHINPTVGRIVWFRGNDGETRAAIVSRVWGPYCVNLHVFAREPGDGEAGDRTSVTHADPATEPGCLQSWSWMPYQKGQAARAEAAEAKAEKA